MVLSFRFKYIKPNNHQETLQIHNFNNALRKIWLIKYVPVSVKAVWSVLVRKIELLEFLCAESISCQSIQTTIILSLTFYFAL